MIIVTNDDGIQSRGIQALYSAATHVFGKGNVLLVAPSGPQSASGMSLTFHKPLRIAHVHTAKIDGYAVSGTPADCVFVAEFQLLKGKPIDLILSGMNEGSNVSVQSVESSGTVSAVKFGAVRDIKGIAFSLAIEMGTNSTTYSNAKFHIIKLLNKIKKNGFPQGANIINVNFPGKVSKSTRWRVCGMESALFNDYAEERKDLMGKPYYWLGGKLKRRFGNGTDCHVLFEAHSVAITPIKLDYTDDALKMRLLKKLEADGSQT
ncbi:MAG: 5'/3'-nucleotidase SurE [Candidatus Micrarchaeaceae archaeon]